MNYTANTVLLCFFWVIPGLAQNTAQQADDRWREAGLPYIQTYLAKDYEGEQQNWHLTQDHRGVMYFANHDCILEYDGVSWRKIYAGVKMPIKSLKHDADGRIWVSAAQDFGYLEPDSMGRMQFVSLLSQATSKDHDANLNWGLEVSSHGVYFHTQNVIFRWIAEADSLKSWRPKQEIRAALVSKGELFVRLKGVGLMKMEGDSLRLIQGGEKFSHIDVGTILPWGNTLQASVIASKDLSQKSMGSNSERLLIVTPNYGLFVYDGVSFQPFKTETDAYLIKNNIECAIVLSDGNIAIGTLYGGLVIIDGSGNLLRILNKSNGLPDNTVYHVYIDAQGGAWLALNKGLARVETPSPFSKHSSAELQTGSPQTLRHQGEIHVTTAQGVYVMKQSASLGAPPVFKAVENLTAQCGRLLSVGDALLVTSGEGIHQIKNNRASLVKKKGIAVPQVFLHSRYDKNRVYVGFHKKFGMLQFKAGKWMFAGYVPGINEYVEGIAEDGPDTLWLTTRYGVVLRVNVEDLTFSMEPDSSTIKMERFGEKHGLARWWVTPRRIEDEIVFATAKGLRQFDLSTRTFPLSQRFGGLFADMSWEFSANTFSIDDLGRVWTSRFNKGKPEMGVAVPQPDGAYVWNPNLFFRFADFGEVWSFYIDDKYNNVFWFSGAEGAIRYDEAVKKDYEAKFPALIRRVIVNNDSVIYGGAYTDPVSMMKAPTLDYEINTIRIEYAAPYYDNPAANQYQFFLEGFEKGWSNWTHETAVDYRMLPEGKYKFRVRARNIYQNVGDESVFALEILPPWYRTWWSYLLYGLMVFGVLYVLRRYEMNRQQHKHRAELEHVATKKLKELDKLKSDFFANISHEFRTPLTLILGPAEQLIQESSESSKKKGKLIRRNVQRLLQLIEQLLDLSKLERNNVQLQAHAGDFIAFLKGLAMSFESLAEQKGIDLQFDVHDARQHDEDTEYQLDKSTYFDGDKIEKIFSNLLSNAFKFTETGGKVKVTGTLIADCSLKAGDSVKGKSHEIVHPICQVCRNDTGTNGSSVNCVEISIADTGVGIPAEQLPHVFDRFFQVDASSRRAHGGTGIGLALVKELVELHHGSIVVTSEEGAGTTFTICLPLGKEHLSPEQLVDTTHTPLLNEAGYIVSPFEEPVLSLSKEGLSEMSESDNDLTETTEAKPTANKPILLIIEDNSDVRAYIREQLQTEYAILEAEDGEAGIARAIEAIPDLVISDVMMPKKDGFEVCRTLKTDTRTSHIPVILLTAKALEKEKLTGFETGADAYVLKPFRQKELAVRVRTLIELRRKLRQRFSTVTVVKPSEVEATSMDRAFLEHVIEIIEARFDDEAFNVEALASAVAMSLSQLNRKLNALIGQPAGHMLRCMRLQRAADLLVNKSGTIAEICYEVGFSDQANFTRAFKKQFNCSPSQYLKSH